MIGGKNQAPLDTIRINPGTTVQSLINLDPIKFTSIKEDGQAILKMYFITLGGQIADMSKFTGSIPWAKPFKDPETDEYTDTLVIKFNIYNKPEYKSEIISQYVDINGKIRLDQLSGTPDKYIMRSINGRSWKPVTDPLSEMEQLAVGDDVSICLREADRTVAWQNFLKEYFLSAEFIPSKHVEYRAQLIAKYEAEFSVSLWDEFVVNSISYYPTIIKPFYDYMQLAVPEASPADLKMALLPSFVDLLWLSGEFPYDFDTYAFKLYSAGINGMEAYWPTLAQEMSSSISTPGPCREVTCLAFEKINRPAVQRSVEIITIPGVTSNPVDGMKHYVNAHEDFEFTLTFSGGEPLKVTATGFYSQRPEEMTGTELGGGLFRYVIRQVAEPWTVTVSAEPASGYVDNEIAIEGDGHVWTYENTLYINSDKAARADIYTLSGLLLKQLNVQAGTTSTQLERGIYIVEIDGSRYKVAVK
jgi:hypothetical protein